MSMTDTRQPALRNDLYIRSEELVGTPAVDIHAGGDIESNADDLVRQLLIEEKRRSLPERLPEIVPQEDVLTYDPVQKRRTESAQESIAQILKAERMPRGGTGKPRRQWLLLPRLALPRVGRTQAAPVRPTSESASVPEAKRSSFQLQAWMRGYRPTRKHVAWAAMAGLVLYRPLMVLIVPLSLLWVVLIAYLTLGPERWGEILGGAWQKLHARWPAMAERLRQRADRFAEHFDLVLDRLPEAWADRLALPDFSAQGDLEDDRPDPFERLAVEARRV